MTTLFRNTMTDLVKEVRRLIGDVEPANGTDADAVWKDVDIQDALDDHRLDLAREPLTWEPNFTGSAVEYTTAASLHDHFEMTNGGTAIFVVETATGTASGTADYSADYRRGVITFTADQNATLYYLTGRSYDVYGAAADILDWWVMAEPVDCLTDSEGRRYFDRTRAKARAEQAKLYRSKSRPVSVPFARGDVR